MGILIHDDPTRIIVPKSPTIYEMALRNEDLVETALKKLEEKLEGPNRALKVAASAPITEFWPPAQMGAWGHAGRPVMEGLECKMVLANVLDASELQSLLPLEILIQPRQSQAQACADSASAALEAKPGCHPSMSVKRPGCLNPAWRELWLEGGR
ncbi:hypothetical protein NDU88_004261 [Pleurodeles waltl]|uniref:Uncharacterized protein n=1 Tax=Pleurodeles waltl TaxID=8319 RepID=A0AAV7PF78_PLEWA|nr:hypothetical protein NDU88_004261 [Pleurodeles waltl]